MNMTRRSGVVEVENLETWMEGHRWGRWNTMYETITQSIIESKQIRK